MLTHYRIAAYLLSPIPRNPEETLAERMFNTARVVYGPRNVEPTPVMIPVGARWGGDSREILTELSPRLTADAVYNSCLAEVPQSEIVCFLEFEEDGFWTRGKQLITPAPPKCFTCFDFDACCPACRLDTASTAEQQFGRDHEMY